MVVGFFAERVHAAHPAIFGDVPILFAYCIFEPSLNFIFLEIVGGARVAWLWPYAAVSILYSLIYPFALCKTILDLICVHVFKSENRRSVSWIVFSCWGIFACMGVVHVRGFFGGQHFAWDFSESWGRDVLERIALQYGQYNHHTAIAFVFLFVIGMIVGFRSAAHRRAICYVSALMFFTLISLLLVVPLSGLFLRARHTLPLLPLFLGGVAIPAVGLLRKLESYFPKRIAMAEALVFFVSIFAFSMTVISPLRIFKREILSSMDAHQRANGVCAPRVGVGRQDCVWESKFRRHFRLLLRSPGLFSAGK